jgi:tetratricopeptide (TPR) repeat protein
MILAATLLCAVLIPARQAAAQEIFAEPDQTLFTVMAAINAAGYDDGAERTDLTPVRAALREELAHKKIPSLEEIREFYKTHRLADPAKDLSQYVSLALLLSGPPNFVPTLDPANLPPDAVEVKDLAPMLVAFYEQAEIPQLWAKYYGQMQQETEPYQRLLTQVIQQTNGYLRMETPYYMGVRFGILYNPLGAAGHVDARNYGDNYYIVVSPSAGPPKEQIQHAWLHYLLDPLVLKYPNAVESKAPLAQYAQRAPALEPAFRNSFGLLTTESLILAVQTKLSGEADAAQQKAIQNSLEEGYVLTPYFYEAMKVFEDQPVGIKLYFPEMLDAIQVDKEKKRLAAVQFRPAPAKPVREARWSPFEQVMRQAQEHLARGEYDQAHELYESLSKQYGPQPAVLYGMALVASQQKQPAAAKEYFSQAAMLAIDPRMKAWSHIYLGRLLDLEGKRDEAKVEYSAALSVSALSPDTKSAAEQGLAKQFERPASQEETPPPKEPARQRVPLGKGDPQ